MDELVFAIEDPWVWWARDAHWLLFSSVRSRGLCLRVLSYGIVALDVVGRSSRSSHREALL